MMHLFRLLGNQITLMAWIYPEQFRNNAHEAFILLARKPIAQIMDICYDVEEMAKLILTQGNGSWNELTTPNQVLELNQWQHVAATTMGLLSESLLMENKLHSSRKHLLSEIQIIIWQ